MLIFATGRVMLMKIFVAVRGNTVTGVFYGSAGLKHPNYTEVNLVILTLILIIIAVVVVVVVPLIIINHNYCCHTNHQNHHHLHV